MLPSLPESARLREYTRPLITLLIVGGFAAWFLAPNYNSARPVGQRVALGSTRAPSVEGLLTEDPLLLVARAAAAVREESAEQRVNRTRAESQGFRQALKSDAGSTLVLCVWTPGSAWPEDSERRIRARHAVVQALTEEQYEVELLRQLAVVSVSARAVLDDEPWLVGYDHYTRSVAHTDAPGANSQAPPSSVVVLWIDESRLGRERIARVSGLLDELLALPPSTTQPIEVLHLGPSSSGVLEGIAKGACVEPKPRMWSPFATKRVDPATASQLVTHVALERTIGYDDAIAKLLVSELQERVPSLTRRRRIALKALMSSANPLVWGATWLQALRLWAHKTLSANQPVRVAVIAEQDTAYGRQWLELLQAEGDAVKAPLAFEAISYIGVIDGGPTNSELHRGTTPNAPSKIDERYPQGATQVDYLSRLEEQLSRQRFDAVGVFGSDFYDTMLVLQVLRPRFPNILFFTIDLDARFSHKAHLPYTRNLIVASHLGLTSELTDDRNATRAHAPQLVRPSFRDIYEHSLYRAVRGAVRSAPPQVPTPRLFEISIHGPVELTRAGLGAAANWDAVPSPLHAPGRAWRQLVHTLETWRSVHAASNGELPQDKSGWSAILAAPALAGVWILVVSIALRPTRARPDSRSSGRARYLFVLVTPPALALAAATLLIAIEDAARHVPMEPIGWFDGVSAWPSIFLRLGATAYCVWGCFEVRRVLLRVHADIRLEHMLFLHAPREPDPCPTLDELLSSQARVRLDVLWESGRRWLADPARYAVRVGLSGLLVAVAFWTFDALVDAGPPVRGVCAYVFERVTWALATWSFASLVFAQVFAASLARKLGVLAAGFARLHISAQTARATAPRGFERSNRLRVPTMIVIELLEAVDRLTWMPALAVAMFVLVRAPIIDAWAWSPALLAGMAYLYVLALIATSRTRRAARSVRRSALELVDKARRKLLARSSALGRLETLASQLEGMTTGAFAPVWQHPLVTSAVYPLLAYAATASPAGSWLHTALRLIAPA